MSDRDILFAYRVEEAKTTLAEAEKMFDRRVDFDYKEQVRADIEDAGNAVDNARKFITELDRFISDN
jgi:hypothetical protein